MDDTAGILYAASISGDGRASPLSGAAVAHEIADDALAWVHLDGRHEASRAWIENELDYLDPLIIDALLADETRPRLLEFENGAMMILRGVNLNADAQPEDMVSVRVWVDPSRIISVERRPLKAVRDIQDKLAAGNGPKDAGEFVGQLSARLFERMEPVMTELHERLDEVEERVMETPSIAERQEITALRKQAIIFRRYFAPQRDVIAYLRTSELDWLSTGHRRRLQENLDRITRYLEDLDAIRERAQIVKDELANALADRMNKNLYVLSLVAAIFLPLGFLTGLLGINVGGIPGADLQSAFWIFLVILAGISAVQIWIFRLMKWL
ncbi:dihydroorotate dehydrogenase [Maricaulis sp. W15]|uniref:zinc transporter ZntB n=1 Tax=Maricaulis sp. W15 TaxID=1772333 RepID=UPI000948B726|nr:zinc transporter ZntB [Maricaulis sp. W15]OLF71346.1 dihydroorotate dehydrogenase [Maricaulis sp. W15]